MTHVYTVTDPCKLFYLKKIKEEKEKEEEINPSSEVYLNRVRTILSAVSSTKATKWGQDFTDFQGLAS